MKGAKQKNENNGDEYDADEQDEKTNMRIVSFYMCSCFVIVAIFSVDGWNFVIFVYWNILIGI